MLNIDLHKLKPKELIARRVKSAKDDLRQLFDGASLKQRVEPVPVPAPSSDEDHIHRLATVAQSWLDFERLFSRRRALSNQTIAEARHDFCQALVQSFSGHSPAASPPQVLQRSSSPTGLPSPRLIRPSPEHSPAPSATTFMDQTAVAFPLFDSMLQEEPVPSPEFSDEELQREFDEFSFHSSQEEEWTSEIESRKQNAMNRALSDMKRQLANPVPRLSSYFSDDSLADSAAHRTLVNPQPACSSAFSEKDGSSSSCSADQEDEVEDSMSVSLSIAITPPESPVCITTLVVDAGIVPLCPVELSLSSQMDDATLDEELECEGSTGHGGTTAASTTSVVVQTGDSSESQASSVPSSRCSALGRGTSCMDNVWEVLATYVPRLLTRISEESLADEYEIHATAQPPVSFRRPMSQYRKLLWFRRQCTSLFDHLDQVDSTLVTVLAEVPESSEAASSSNAGRPLAVTTGTEDGPISTLVVNSVKTLRRARKFMDLKVSYFGRVG